MTLTYLHRHESELSTLGRHIAHASVNPWTWPAVLRAMEELATNTACEIVAESPGPDGAPRLLARITAEGLHFCDGGAASPRALTHRFGGRDGGLFPADGEGGEETALFLGRSGSAAWFLVVGARMGGDRRATFPRMRPAQLLDSAAPVLAGSFRIALALAEGERPAEADCRLVWDRLRHGVVLATPDLEILCSNAAGEDLMTIRSLFRSMAGAARLRPVGEVAGRHLERAVERVCRGETWRAGLRVASDEMLGGVLVDIVSAGHSPFAPSSERARSREHLLVTLRELTAREPARISADLRSWADGPASIDARRWVGVG